jgi:hypothetical protein
VFNKRVYLLVKGILLIPDQIFLQVLMKTIYFNLNKCLCLRLGLIYFLNSKLLLLLYSFLQINNNIVGVGILLKRAAGCCLYTIISILLQEG